MKTHHLLLRGEPTCIFLEIQAAMSADGQKMPVDPLAPRILHGRERQSDAARPYAFCDLLSLHNTLPRNGSTIVTTVMADQVTSQIGRAHV